MIDNESKCFTKGQGIYPRSRASSLSEANRAIAALQNKVEEQRKHIAIMARALSEIKATDDGHSDQEVGTILSWSIEQIATLKENQ